ncbi:HpcH/HpaI aldolase/citrate lyase family protein [Roseomonas populi]|uniref:CoA ester lyase n=1 Tax=Roseomonas populi TaxID=3121582 RepID=A0ABT1X587_9PROT|nr:CoA ester lyase [Roseomonas pecuniae]MCR0982548.1 CoA ester lyase [Roseomonas pecuniae]
MAPAIMRSKLFVPGSRPELFAKAVASRADALSFDLEDAVAPNRKEKARENLAGFLRGAEHGGKVIVVRVNGTGTPHFLPDLSAVAVPGTHMVNLPMVGDAAEVRDAAAALERAERENGVTEPIGLLCNVETPRALRLAHEIAAAHPRVRGLQIGYADLLEPAGIDRMDEAVLAHLRMTLRLAAAEAGVPAYDGAFAKVDRPDAYRAEAEAARRMGFAGKSCIHPSQIVAANEVFQPTLAEIARARRVVEAAREQIAAGTGAFMVDGGMVDAPFIASAEALLGLAQRLGLPATD